MNRTVKWALVLVAAAGMAGLPGIASAHSPSNGGLVVIGDDNQIAGNDIFNAGHDNTVGSHNGSNAGVGMGAVASAEEETGHGGGVVIGDRNQLAGDDLFNAANDNTVGSWDGNSSMVGAASATNGTMNGLVDL
ncbi:hypothetical protein GCM10009665_22290 [Kitasatospora nipponensis]|uniref:Small secreted domain DUF320 n=1 Tax=Kitasatospora nipponensis TaxID=258049 RepID=A0ABN1W2E3_9ACTN